MNETIKLTECPRDAMQGIKALIPTEMKIDYLNQLLKSGFDVLDFGSFVSPKSIPQMLDTASVLRGLDLTSTKTELLAIIANVRGAMDACSFSEIAYLGFPFSVSETFQKRNTNSTIEESLQRVEEIQALAARNGKKLLIYLSMAFGNPYGDEWNPEVVIRWGEKLAKMGIEHMALADTIGSSTPDNIKHLFTTLLPALPQVQLGAHLHSTPAKTQEKIDAAWKAGVRSFDVAVHGFGGCPMAMDELTGNMATEQLLSYCHVNHISTKVNQKEIEKAYEMAWPIFQGYH